MDRFHKSYSYYDTTNAEDEYSTSKPSMYQSQSFAFGSNNYDSYAGFSDSKSSINQVDQFHKSHSYYETTNVADEYSTSKATMNHSQSFAFGSHNYDNYACSDFKSTINQFGNQEPIKEESYETNESKNQYEITPSQRDDEELRRYADQMKENSYTSNLGNEYKFD